MCQRYMSTSQSDQAGGRARQRARAALDARQPAGGRPHHHAREAEQEQQRRDVAQQHVLDHVRREQVVLAEPVERGDERRQQREHPPAKASACKRPSAPPPPRPPASRAPCAPARSATCRCRRAARAARAPAGSANQCSCGWPDACHRHARDCRNGVPTRNTSMRRRDPCCSTCSPRRCAGPAARPPRGEPLCRACRGRPRSASPPEPLDLRGLRVWAPVPTRARRASSCGR